ncbi:MAG: hypothetical protein ABH864_05440 [archaeon]
MKKALIFAAVFLVLVGVGYSVFSSEIACAIVGDDGDGCGVVQHSTSTVEGSSSWTQPFAPTNPSCGEQCNFFTPDDREEAIASALAKAMENCGATDKSGDHPGGCPSACPLQRTKTRCSGGSSSVSGVRDGSSCVCTATGSVTLTTTHMCSRYSTYESVASIATPGMYEPA